MASISIANLKKTFYYLRRNGLRRTLYAVRERLEENGRQPYQFIPLTQEESARQKKTSEELGGILFSIVVPTYRTDPEYLREMFGSVQAQTYPYWELILADATEDESVRSVVAEYENDREPGRIVYIRLDANEGISRNTNAALRSVKGDYVGLLDHDDILTENALFEMAEQIFRGREKDIDVSLLYSDEDKCDRDQSRYYEPNFKEKFNLDLILSNNYICHFMVMKKELIQELGFRSEYDGAQDHDLVLRAVDRLQLLHRPQEERSVIHIPKVLYHWRCHAASTAGNPQSKQYAYDAGMRAIKDFAVRNGIGGEVVPLSHVGFFRIAYEGDPLAARSDLGAVGGKILLDGRIAGGRMDDEGNVFYEGLPAEYSGAMHRAVLTQDADAVDIRCIWIREELRDLFAQIVGVPYQCLPGDERFDVSGLEKGGMKDKDYKEISLRLCRAIRERGYRILWLPDRVVEIKNGAGHE